MRLTSELRDHLRSLLAEEQWVRDAGFRPPCIGALNVIAERGPVSQREISEALGVDPSDLVGVIDILETAGTVERRRDPDDRRRHAVALTAEGERAVRRLAVLTAKAEARALARLSPEERKLLSELAWKAAGESRAPLAPLVRV